MTDSAPPALPAYPEETRPGFWRDIAEAIREVRAYRELLRELALREIRIRYKQAVLGFGWALLMPLLIVAAGLVLRLAAARFAGGGLERDGIIGVAIKSLPWAFFVGSLNFATPSLTGNLNLVSKIYFPREVLPLAAVLAQAFDTAIGATAVLAVALVLGLTPSMAWLWFPALVILLFALTTAAALFLSSANVFFRDVKYLVQVFLTFGILFTPVFFEPAMLGARGARLMLLNPLGTLVEGFRLAIVEGHNLLIPLVLTPQGGPPVVAWDPVYFALLAGWSLGGLLVAVWFFHRSAAVFAERL